MNESSVSRALRRWGERVILTAMVLAGFGIGTAGLALVGERWQDDPVVLDDPTPRPVDEPTTEQELVAELAVGTGSTAAPESIVVLVGPDPGPEPALEAEPARDRERGDRERGRRRAARRR